MSSQQCFFLKCSSTRFWDEENSVDCSVLSVTEICKTVLSACLELSSVMLSACEHGLLRTYSHFSDLLRSAVEMSRHRPLHASRTNGGKNNNK